MRALVTGGMGFIGNAIVRRLLQDGYDVTIIDNLFDPYMRTMESGSNCQMLLLPIDVTDLQEMCSRLAKQEFDAVFHFAAHYANTRSLEEPMTNVRTNMMGTMAVLELARRLGVKKFVYASSSGVYGGLPIVAYSENQPPAPSTPYEVTKYAGELLCDGYCTIYGISLASPRYFNVYGPGDLPGEWRSVVPMFFRNAKQNKPLVVTGKMASRDFTYIDDAVSATLAGLKRLEEVPDRVSLVYNVGTGTEVFVKQLAEKIIVMTESKSEIKIEDQRHWDNAPRRVADCHKFHSLFPSVSNSMKSVDEGLKLSAKWYMEVC